MRVPIVAFLLGLVVGAIILIAVGMPALHRTAAGTADFSYIWAGPRTILDGGDPYDAAQWAASVARLRTQPYVDPAVYSYPPYVALALLPLGALPLAVADQLWLWGGLAAAAVTLLFVLRVYAIDHAAIAFVAALVLLISQPSAFTFHDSQWSFILVAALGLLAVALRRRRPLLAALGTAILLAKPHLVAIPLGGLVWQAWRRGDRAVAVSIGAAATVIVAVSVAIAAQWWLAWLAEVPRARAVEPNIVTLPQAVAALPLGALIAYTAMVLAAIAALASDSRRPAAAAMWMTLGLIATPYARSYDQLLLLVPCVIACEGVGPRGSRLMAAAIALVLLVLPWAIFIAVSPALGSESGAAMVPLAVLALVLARHRAAA